ncbi:homoserine kinase [Ruania halotolerans]|uniref:homoserine kinase n=1 Tax=Ruania halotolerans TaxID=2897773 RepID=UPI001E3F3ED2|nr:homoserine kinase [Ruania halotolerans]UFU07643.1 homoserine kinase [Ruania halotolerans]
MRLVRDEVRVRVPATSANLGPGFDAFGLAHTIHDHVRVRATTGETEVRVIGEGAGEVSGGDDHLVVRALRAGLDHVGAPQAGFSLDCENAIPHGRGLGSSAAAVVAGLVAARGLISEPEALNDRVLLELATDFEGHPDNAAPALLGGATVAWMQGRNAHAARIEVDSRIALTVLVPTERLPTKRARAALPATVSHADAAFNAGRAGLLTLALTSRPDLLMAATEDRLHQTQRADAMMASIALVGRLREAGHPAVVSGAGPTVLVFDDLSHRALELAGLGSAVQEWSVRRPSIDLVGAQIL